MNQEKKSALVLGGIKGIGKAVAMDFLKQGLAVTVCYYDWESHLDSLQRDLSSISNDFLVVRANLTRGRAAHMLVERAVEHFGRLDVLINNIERGGWPVVHGPYTEEQWALEMDTTLKAKKWVFDKAFPYLKATSSGSVVNISSIAGIVGRSGPAGPVFNEGYAAANQGVSSLTRTWARLGAPEVRVNEVMLGFVESRHGPGTRGWGLLSNNEKQNIMDHTLLERTAAIEEAAGTIAFVALSAPFMTGARIILDGGYILGGDRCGPMPAGCTSPDEDVFGS